MILEAGKSYKIVWIEEGNETSVVANIIEVELPLFRIVLAGADKVINSTSPMFVSAERVGPDIDAARDASHKRFLATLDYEGEDDREDDDDTKNRPSRGVTGY